MIHRSELGKTAPGDGGRLRCSVRSTVCPVLSVLQGVKGLQGGTTATFRRQRPLVKRGIVATELRG